MHSFECWIQLGLKQDLLLGFLLWELINFLFGPSHLSIVSAPATKEVLTTCKDTPVCVLYSHMTTLLTRRLTVGVCEGCSTASNSLSQQRGVPRLTQF